MTETSTPAPAPAATVCTTAILASDFSQDTTDVNRHTWTLGKMRYAIAALDGAPVAIIADNGTGFTLVGARLVDAFDGGPARGPRVTIATTYVDEKGAAIEQRTHYSLRNIGETIIVLADDKLNGGGAKWRATKAVMDDAREAVTRAQAAHGEIEGRAWGRWNASVDTAVPGKSMQVTYKPLKTNPAFADQWGTSGYWTIDISEQANA